MRLAIYYPIHFIGIFLLFMCIGAMCIHVRNGGDKKENPSRKFLAITHGVALLLVMTGGMGLMTAYSYFNPIPTFVIIKLVIWLILGFSSLLIYKLPQLSTLFFFIFVALGALAGLSAHFKFWSVYTSYFQ